MRYDEPKAGPIETLVAPPYDVISPEDRRRYLAQSPYNVVHLTLPDSEEQAARELGTWRRDCIMEDVSETGARLTVVGNIEGLNLKEFFLLLSSTGLAYRRCELAWVNGDQIGVNFLKTGDKKKKATRRAAADA